MSKKVLTIDDSKTVRLIITKHLSVFGVEVLEAENGEIGVAKAKEGLPDLILLDYNMPVKDGYSTLIELKDDPATNPIPVIMLTTETVQDTVLKLIKLGLRDYIAKPFTREILLKKTNPILELYQGDEPPAPGAQTASPAGPPRPEGSDGKTIVLAIDDKANILKMVEEYLGDQYFVIKAETGAAAAEAMKQQHFDYMFLDLTMPDMNWADIYKSYTDIKKDAATPKKVAAMTLRTAEADIAKAAGFGIQVVLYKPFTAMDVTGSIENLQMLASGKKLPWLERYGNIRILRCPGDKNPKLHAFVTALRGEVLQEVEGMAEEGLTGLVIDLGEGFLSSVNIAQKFITFIEHTAKLKLNIRLVGESSQALAAIKNIAEIAHLPTDTSLDLALKAFE
jgi:two-component system cell cycle response regulator